MASMKTFMSAGMMSVAHGAYTFMSIGDWGGATLGGDHKDNEVAVAKQMGQTAAELSAKFVINTGDNFYYCGVQNISDSQFQTDFEDVFTATSLYVPWYGVLGNHDYAYDLQAQINYKSPHNDRWQIPDLYYTKRIQLDASQYATLVFVDSNPCIKNYRGDDPAGWDPCSGTYGECKETSDNVCHFHDHIVAQDCHAQYIWLQKTLAAISAEDWKIVVGHHEADQINVEDFTGLMLDNNIHLYLNGHTHALKHYQIDGRADIDFFTSGAGCMVHTHDQDHLNLPSWTSSAFSHTPKELFYQADSGFTVHTFSDDFSELTTKVIDAKGKTIHSFVTKRQKQKSLSNALGVVV